MADVFLSYKSEDRELVSTLAHALEQAGISVWWDKKIVAGGSWRETIASALAQAKVVVVAWSRRTENSADAAWVFNEVDEAQRKKLPIIPVQLEPCDIPLGYRQVQAANLAGWRGDAKNPEWQEVLEGVRAAIEGRAVGGAAARRPQAPAPRRSGSPMGAIVGIVALIVLAGGGYVAWSTVQKSAQQTEIAAQSAMQIDAPQTPAAPKAAATAQVQPTLEATGAQRAQIVNYANPSQSGYFQRESGAVWGEYQSGIRVNNFRLVSDSEAEVVLYDESRDMTMRLDLRNARIFWRSAKEAENYVYNVISVNRPPEQPPQTAPITIARINFSNSTGASGSFRHEQGDDWVEYTAAGERAFQFRRRAQTAQRLELYDSSRDMLILIDLAGKRVFWRQANGPNNYVYEVISIER